MANDTAREDTYVCVMQAPDEPFPTSFRVSDDIAELVSWGEAGGAEEATTAVDQSPETKESQSITLGSLMARIIDSSHQQFEMTMLLSAVREIFPASIVQTDIVEAILTESNIVRKNDAFNVFEIKEDKVVDFYRSLGKLNRLTKGFAVLPNSILLSMIATFDSQMSDIVREMLKIKSDKLRSGQRTVPLSEIMSATSLEQVIENAVNDEVYVFSRNSHSDQVKYIEDNFDIDIRKKWKRWPDLIEIFETRNLVAHGEKTYTKRYVEICTKNGHKGSDKILGNKIDISSKYLRQSLNLLDEFSILLIFSLWRKHVPQEESEAFSALNHAVFELITNRRFTLAVFISEYALTLENTKVKEAVRLMFVVNLASAHMHKGNEDAANRVLDKVDWSATADSYRICVAAIKKDIDNVVQLIPIVSSSGSVSLDDFRNWPAFDFVKKEQKFTEAFAKVFGQPFDKKSQARLEGAVARDEAVDDAIAPPTDTKH